VRSGLLQARNLRDPDDDTGLTIHLRRNERGTTTAVDNLDAVFSTGVIDGAEADPELLSDFCYVLLAGDCISHLFATGRTVFVAHSCLD
jgi:hypothetical protein